MKSKIMKGDGGMSLKKLKFADLFDYENKSSIKAGDGFNEGKYPFYTSSSIQSKYLNEFSFENISLIFGTGGNASIHYCEKPFSVSTDCLVAIAKDETKCHPKFVYYYLSGNINLLEEGFKGAGLKHISKAFINEIQIPLPPLPIQKRIAEILDVADALRRKDQELLLKYDKLAQAIFIDMFGDPVKNEKGWKEQIIKDIAAKGKHSIKAGPFGSSLKKEYYKLIGYKIYGQEQVIADDFSIGDYYIDEEKFTELQNCSIQSGDILISLVGTYGKISVVPQAFEKGIINPRLMKITLNKSLFNPYFFKFLLQTEQMYNRIGTYSRGGTMDIVNVGIISEVIVIVPPLDMQNRFMEMLFSINAQKKIIQKKMSDNLFDSLLQQAFKGNLVK